MKFKVGLTISVNMDYLEVSEMEMELINRIVKLSHETSADTDQILKTNKDWEFLKYLWEFWKVNQADHLEQFRLESGAYRAEFARSNEFAELKNEDGSKGRMDMRHLGLLPSTFQKLIKKYFPKQELDEKFYKRLSKEIPELSLLETKNI